MAGMMCGNGWAHGGRMRLLAALLALAPLAVSVAGDGMAVLEARCSGCHDLKGPTPQTLEALRDRKGPDLFYAGNKYRREWLVEWLQKPVRIRPAGMYYGRHIRSTPDGDVIDASTLEPHPALDAATARAVAATLMTFKAKGELIHAGEFKPGHISLSMGELMFDKFRGCLACHEIEPGYGGLSGPEVYTVGRRLQPDYMISYMRDPQAWDPRIFMPNKHLKDSDLQKFVRYFEALSKEDFE